MIGRHLVGIRGISGRWGNAYADSQNSRWATPCEDSYRSSSRSRSGRPAKRPEDRYSDSSRCGTHLVSESLVAWSAKMLRKESYQ